MNSHYDREKENFHLGNLHDFSVASLGLLLLDWLEFSGKNHSFRSSRSLLKFLLYKYDIFFRCFLFTIALSYNRFNDCCANSKEMSVQAFPKNFLVLIFLYINILRFSHERICRCHRQSCVTETVKLNAQKFSFKTFRLDSFKLACFQFLFIRLRLGLLGICDIRSYLARLCHLVLYVLAARFYFAIYWHIAENRGSGTFASFRPLLLADRLYDSCNSFCFLPRYICHVAVYPQADSFTGIRACSGWRSIWAGIIFAYISQSLLSLWPLHPASNVPAYLSPPRQIFAQNKLLALIHPDSRHSLSEVV